MPNNKKVIVVMPAYNAAKTLRRTYDEVMTQGVVDLMIVEDDVSQDDKIARTLPQRIVHVQEKNRGMEQSRSGSRVQFFPEASK
jgi:glycosyltransferase involved in cell wall biosynthesis